MRFEDLPKPFVCVARKSAPATEIWLSSGVLITRQRLYALPGVFEPVSPTTRVVGRRRAGQLRPGLGLPRL